MGCLRLDLVSILNCLLRQRGMEMVFIKRATIMELLLERNDVVFKDYAFVTLLISSVYYWGI